MSCQATGLRRYYWYDVLMHLLPALQTSGWRETEARKVQMERRNENAGNDKLALQMPDQKVVNKKEAELARIETELTLLRETAFGLTNNPSVNKMDALQLVSTILFYHDKQIGVPASFHAEAGFGRMLSGSRARVDIDGDTTVTRFEARMNIEMVEDTAALQAMTPEQREERKPHGCRKTAPRGSARRARERQSEAVVRAFC